MNQITYLRVERNKGNPIRLNNSNWTNDDLEHLKTFAKYCFEQKGMYDWDVIAGVMGNSADECQRVWNHLVSSSASNKTKDLPSKQSKLNSKSEILKHQFDVMINIHNTPKDSLNLIPPPGAKRKREEATDIQKTKSKRQKLDLDYDAKILLSFWQYSQNIHLRMINHNFECHLCPKKNNL